MPKPLRDIQKVLDTSNPIQSAIFTVFKDYPNNFANIQDGIPDQDFLDQMRDDYLAFPAYDEAKSSMDRLRETEIIVDSTRKINVPLEGAGSYYWEQEIIQPGATAMQRFVIYTFDVPYEDRVAKAHEIFNQLQPMFRKAKKWAKSGTEDANLNSLYGQLTMGAYLKMGSGGATMLTVSVDYGQTEEIHRLSQGVALKILLLDLKY